MTRCSSRSSVHISFHAELRQVVSVVTKRRAMRRSTSVSGRSMTSARPSEPSRRSTDASTSGCSRLMMTGGRSSAGASTAHSELEVSSAWTRDHMPCSTPSSSNSVSERSSLVRRVVATRQKVSAARLRRSWCSALNLTVRRKSTTRFGLARLRAGFSGPAEPSLEASTSAATASADSRLIGSSPPWTGDRRGRAGVEARRPANRRWFAGRRHERLLLTQQRQDVLRQLVGLRQHRRAGLRQDLGLGHLDRLGGHVDVADARLGGHQVLLVDRDVVQRVLEAVLDRTERGALGRDRVDRGVDLGDVSGAARGQRGVVRADRLAERDHADGDDLTVVGADLERHGRRLAVQQADAVELRGLTDALDLRSQLVDLGLDRRLVGRAERAVLELDGQLADALEHVVHRAQGAFGGLHERDAVADVALILGQAADLGAHLLRDGKTGGVVGRAVDPVAGAQALHGLADLSADAHQVAMRVERLDVVLDAKGHESLLDGPWGDSLSPALAAASTVRAGKLNTG